MYAVIKTGGKQYRVKEGDVLKVEMLPIPVGDEVNFIEVLMIADGDNIVHGKPLIADATVKATVMEQARHKKIRIIKFRRRKHHLKHMGHRQYYTQIKITAISQKG